MELIAAGEFGRMLSCLGANVGSAPISDAVGRLKTVVPSGNLIRTARALGISMGDWDETVTRGENAGLFQLHEEVQDLLPVLW